MILSLSLVAAAAAAQPGEAQPLRRVAALLDYVAGDYAKAIGEHGEVLSEAEHAEQIGFVQDAARELRLEVGGRGVAFQVLTLAHRAASARGVELARAAMLPTRYQDLAALSDDDLRRRLVAAGLSPGEQEEAMAAVRAGPFAEDRESRPQGLAQARRAVQQAVSLARSRDRDGARRALISA